MNLVFTASGQDGEHVIETRPRLPVQEENQFINFLSSSSFSHLAPRHHCCDNGIQHCVFSLLSDGQH